MTEAQFADRQIGRRARYGCRCLGDDSPTRFEPLHEAVNLSFSVNDALFTGVERVTMGANIARNSGPRRADGPFGAARGTVDLRLRVPGGVNILSHMNLLNLSSRNGPNQTLGLALRLMDYMGNY